MAKVDRLVDPTGDAAKNLWQRLRQMLKKLIKKI